MKKGLLLIAITGLFALGITHTTFAQEENVVTIVKYSDYQCPACAYFHPFTVKIKEDFGDKVKVVYKNFPLNSHRFSQISARAAEAARKQGKHQEMHNKLFENQATWSRGNAQTLILGYAQDIGLDMNQFKRDLNSAAMQQLILNDKQEGIDAGVGSTPTFFINGKKLANNPGNYDVFKTIVQSYMK